MDRSIRRRFPTETEFNEIRTFHRADFSKTNNGGEIEREKAHLLTRKATMPALRALLR
jgi:hypothetical protein